MEEILHDSQLLKGVLTMVLLHLIEQQESYGYELVERVHALGLSKVPDGSVYPALNRLEREGHIVSHLVSSTTGPVRKYYRLSPTGRRLLEERRRSWLWLVQVLAPLFETEMQNRMERTQ